MKTTGLCLLLGSMALSWGAHAQTEIPPLLEKPHIEEQKQAVVKVRNVPVQIIAHWLEPQSFAKSSLEENSDLAWKNSGYDVKDTPQLKPPVPVKLLADVRIEKAIKEQNCLLISGTTTGVSETEELIRQLDKPLQQIEVECQIVRVQNKALKAANFQFAPVGKTMSGSTVQQAHAKQSGMILNDWVKNESAKILTAPRAVAIVGTASSLRTETVTLLPFALADDNLVKTNDTSDLHFDLTNTPADRMPRLNSSLGITVVPEMKDNAVKIRVQLSRNLSLSFSKPSSVNESEKIAVLRKSQDGELSEANYGIIKKMSVWTEKDRHFLRATDGFDQVIENADGKTVVFSGVNEDTLWGKATSKEVMRERRDTSLIAFVTCRFIHRLEQSSPVPGT